MTFRDAAALALVLLAAWAESPGEKSPVGWYLLAPPISDGRINTSAPLNTWETVRAYDDETGCETFLRQAMSPPGKTWRQTADEVDVPMAVHELGDDGRCVAGDDPRLKDN